MSLFASAYCDDKLPLKMNKQYHVAVAGVTGAVGTELLNVLERRNFPVATLRPLATSRSIGRTVRFRGESIPVQELNEHSWDGIDLMFFSAGGEASRKFVPLARASGTIVIDNSSVFRM